MSPSTSCLPSSCPLRSTTTQNLVECADSASVQLAAQVLSSAAKPLDTLRASKRCAHGWRSACVWCMFVFVGLAHRPLACLPRRKRTSPFAGSQRVCVIPCTHCATVQCVPLSLNHGAVFNHILPKHNLTPSVQQCPQPWYTRGLSTYLETLDTYNIPKRTYFVHDDLTWFIVFVLFLAVSVRSSFSINRKSFVNFHSFKLIELARANNACCMMHVPVCTGMWCLHTKTGSCRSGR